MRRTADAPLREQPVGRAGEPSRRLVAGGRRPGQLQSLEARPGADGEPGERGGAERRRLPLRGHLDRHAREVGLELHQKAVCRRAAVGAQDIELELHRVQHVVRLEGDRLERGAHEMLAPRPARQPGDQPARVRRPVRRAEAGERRDEVDALVAVERTRERLGLGGALDQPEAVAQPLDRGAGDEDGALERIDGGRRRRAATQRSRSTPSGPAPAASSPHSRARTRRSRRSPSPGRARSSAARRAPPAGRRRSRRRARARRAALPRRRRRSRGRPSGARARGTEKRSSSSSSQSSVSMSRSIVREAFETSVTCSPAELPERATSRPCRRRGRPPRRRSRAATRASSPRSTGRGRGRCARGSAPRAARRSARPSAGPARRSRGAIGVAASLVPDERRLALVRDPDRVELARPRRPRRSAPPSPRRAPSARSRPRRARRARAPGSAGGAPGSRARRVCSDSSSTRQVVPVVPWSIARSTGELINCERRPHARSAAYAGYSYWSAFEDVQPRGPAGRSDRREDAGDDRDHDEDDERPDRQRERDAVLRQRLGHERRERRRRAGVRAQRRSAR